MRCLVLMLMRLGRGSPTVTPPPQPVIGEPYVWRPLPTGAVPPYRTQLSGALPAGLAWAARGARIEGTATEAGRFPIKLIITGRDRVPYVLPFVLIVLPLPLRLVGRFRAAEIGSTLPGSLTVQGGTPGYVLRSVTGNVPPGITVELYGDTITAAGICTASGTFTFDIHIGDAMGRWVAFPVTVVVGSIIVNYDYVTTAGVPYVTTAGDGYTTLPIAIV